MKESEIQFCPQCGKDSVTVREITASHMVELYCPHCGILAVLIPQEQELVGTSVTHDPDSDSEPW